MFIERLDKKYIEKHYLKPLEKVDACVITPEKGIMFALIRNISESSQRGIYISDFFDDIDDTQHMKRMYALFGDEYKEAYIKFLNNIVFVKE